MNVRRCREFSMFPGKGIANSEVAMLMKAGNLVSGEPKRWKIVRRVLADKRDHGGPTRKPTVPRHNKLRVVKQAVFRG